MALPHRRERRGANRRLQGAPGRTAAVVRLPDRPTGGDGVGDRRTGRRHPLALALVTAPISVPVGSDFTLANLPFGVAEGRAHVAIGEYAVDLARAAAAGLLDDGDRGVF